MGPGQETLGVHRFPHRAVRREVQGKGGNGLRGRGRGEEGRGGQRGRRAEDRGGRRGEGEGGEEKEDEEGEGSLARVGAAQQEQTAVDAKVRGRDQRGVCLLLQVPVQRLGGPPGCEALQRRGPARVPRAALRTSQGSLRFVRIQEETQQYQALRPACFHH